MMDHQDIGENHNAPVCAWCYKRMGEFIRQLPGEGRQPRTPRPICFVRMRQQDAIVLATYGRSSGYCVDPVGRSR